MEENDLKEARERRRKSFAQDTSGGYNSKVNRIGNEKKRSLSKLIVFLEKA